MITGASRGIGLEMCRIIAMATAGGDSDSGVRSESSSGGLSMRSTAVLAVCRSASPALLELAKASDGRLEICHGVDLCDDDDDDATQVADVIVRALRGRTVQLLVHNAGTGSVEDVADMDHTAYAKLESLYRLHCLAPLALTVALEKRGCLAEGSKVALLGSNLACVSLVGSAGSPPKFVGYRLSKAALSMAAALLTEHLRARGTVVGIVHPGPTNTEMTQRCVGEKIASSLRSPRESANGVLRVVRAMSIDHTGGFWKAPGEDGPVECAPSMPL